MRLISEEGGGEVLRGNDDDDDEEDGMTMKNAREMSDKAYGKEGGGRCETYLRKKTPPPVAMDEG